MAEEKFLLQESKVYQRQIDNYYNRICLPIQAIEKADEKMYCKMMDESAKTIAVQEEKVGVKKNDHKYKVKVNAVMRYLPNIWNFNSGG